MNFCPQCGAPLNENGVCPNCSFGVYAHEAQNAQPQDNLAGQFQEVEPQAQQEVQVPPTTPISEPIMEQPSQTQTETVYASQPQQENPYNYQAQQQPYGYPQQPYGYQGQQMPQQPYGYQGQQMGQPYGYPQQPVQPYGYQGQQIPQQPYGYQAQPYGYPQQQPMGQPYGYQAQPVQQYGYGAQPIMYATQPIYPQDMGAQPVYPQEFTATPIEQAQAEENIEPVPEITYPEFKAEVKVRKGKERKEFLENVPEEHLKHKMTYYQKKLIPLNIFVCVLCIAAIVSLLFLPNNLFDYSGTGITGLDWIMTSFAMADTFDIVVGFTLLGFAVIWLIQLLFAFIRTFTKNKRFCMWYTKLLCWIPFAVWLLFILGYVQPVFELIFGTPLPTDVLVYHDMAAQIVMIGWISGACVIVLWAVSIFWAFPIKRKIRKIKKQMKMIELEAQQPVK